MADLKRQAARHEAWWRRDNDVPLVKNYCPQPVPCGGLDIDVPVEHIAERKCRNAEALHESPALQDSLITAQVNFATALYPAVAGAGWRFDEHTSWTLPAADRAADVEIRPFDPGHPLYARYARRLEKVLEHWSWETYLPVVGGYDGPADILAGLLGPETLALELYESPDAVRAAVDAATDFMCDVIDHERSLLRSAGLDGTGSATLFGTWQPGWAALYVEDFTALIGPDHYRRFFLEADRRIVSRFDSVLFHTHSAGWRNIEVMLELPEAVAFEFGNDPGGPDTDRRIEVVRSIQAAGRPVVCGSWNVPLPAAEMQRIVSALPAGGLDIRFQCGTQVDALDLYHRIKSGESLA